MAKDITADDAARKELIQKYWKLATPTIVINDRVLVGFRENRSEIERLLHEGRG